MNPLKKVPVLIVIFLISLANVTAQIVEKSKSNVQKNEFFKTVAQDGTGDYISIQEAVNDSKSFPYQRITIFVKKGIYHEKVKIHEWNSNISLIGESTENTIITFDDHFKKINLGINSTFYTYTVLVEGDGFAAQNLTIGNASGDIGQAIALSIHADKVQVLNCRILGNQDTLYISGNGFRNYFKDCFIQGTTDFIFGNATAFFENCVLNSLKDSYITAASTPKGVEYGFVFNNCKLTSEKEITQVYLGRPWRIYAKTVFLNCKMNSHIKPEGWHNWSKPDAEKNSFYAEFNCSGNGYMPMSRVNWSHQLKKSQAKKYTLENCMGSDFSKIIKEWKLSPEK